MESTDQNGTSPSLTPEGTESIKKKITPDLVNKIADKVYAAMILELKIEHERSRLIGCTQNGKRRG